MVLGVGESNKMLFFLIVFCIMLFTLVVHLSESFPTSIKQVCVLDDEGEKSVSVDRAQNVSGGSIRG